MSRTIAAMQIQEFVTAARSPWQNAYVERFIGSIRRECLDHVIVLSAAGLQRTRSSKSNSSEDGAQAFIVKAFWKRISWYGWGTPHGHQLRRGDLGATRCFYMVRLLQEAKPRDLGTYLAPVDGWVIVGSALV